MQSRHGVQMQRGAVLPIALFFFAVLCVGLFAVYNMAQVTGEKRHLTNAADAIAFSSATVAAEGLNYTAYTNRAMISNYQSVGQLTAMWSTVGMSNQYWRNNTKLIKAIAALARFIPFIGPEISTIAKVIGEGAEPWAKVLTAVRAASQLLANAGAATVSLTNYSLFVAQQAHLATTFTAMANLPTDLLQANAPKAEYIPAAVVYQFGKSMADFGSMIKLHQPPRKFLGLKQDPDPKKFNLVHRLMIGEMFNFTSGIGGRRLLPNSVGLWTTDGCHFSGHEGALSGVAVNGMGSILPGLAGPLAPASALIGGVLKVIGNLASPIMCIYTRVGGTRMMQMQDGTYGWSNIDLIEVDPGLFNIHIPLAGAVTMSKVGRQGLDANQEIPEDLEKFVNVVKGDDDPLDGQKNRYWGEATGLDDCLYFTLPNGEVYAPRINGMCASLASGIAKGNGKATGGYYRRGAFAVAPKSADSAMTGKSAFAAANREANEALMAPLTPTMEAAGSGINSASSSQAAINLRDNLAGNATGVLGGAPAGMPAAGAALSAPLGGGDAEVELATALAQQAANFQRLSNLGGNLASSISNMLGGAFSLADSVFDEPVSGISGLLKDILNLFGLGDLVELSTMRSSRGTETLWQKGPIGADLGLPAERFGMWEMRGANLDNYQMGERGASNLSTASREIQNNALKDLGPTFLIGLQEPLSTLSLRSESKFNAGKTPIKDYDADINTAYMKAIGKARVYYRAPLERWTTRAQVVSHANLMLPYWNARLEGINYPEKLLFSGLDAISN